MGILKGCIDLFSDKNTNNSSFQNYTHPEDHAIRTTDIPGFKPFILHCFLERGSPTPNRWHHGMANKKLKCALSYFKQTEHVVFIF